MTNTIRMTRRQFFGKLGEGSLVVGFSLSPVAASMLAREAHAASAASQLTVLSGIASGPPPENDAWLAIDHQGNVTLFSGKVEIGTGTQTAFSQIVAEELDVDVSAITYVQGDTSQTPDQGIHGGQQIDPGAGSARPSRGGHGVSRSYLALQPRTSVFRRANSWRKTEASGSVPE